MKKCEPWSVAAIYLMQSPSGRAHYTKIVSYILQTQLTELVEKSVATSHAVTEMLNQKVINGHAIFNNDGNGYYSLNDRDGILNNEAVQGVIQCLKGNDMEVNLPAPEEKHNGPAERDEIQESDDNKLGDEARRLSDEARRLSDQTKKLSDETIKLSDENKKLREEAKGLREEARGLSDENEQLKEKLESIRQLCEQV